MQILFGPAFDIVDRLDGLQRVLVHREVVIHVELRLTHDAAELRQEAPKNARFVH